MKTSNINDINILKQIIEIYEHALSFYLNREMIKSDVSFYAKQAFEMKDKILNEYENAVSMYNKYSENLTENEKTNEEYLKVLNELKDLNKKLK